MTEMLEQLEADSQSLSCLPFVLSDKGSNKNFTIFKTVSPTLFCNPSRGYTLFSSFTMAGEEWSLVTCRE